MKKVKFLIYAFALMLCFNVVSFDVTAAVIEKNDIGISYTVSKNTIYEGTEFEIEVDIQKDLHAADIPAGSNPTLYIDTDSFIIKDGYTIALDRDDINARTEHITLELECIGSSKTIPITIKYKDGSDNEIISTNKFLINNIFTKDTSDDDNSNIDTSKYKPELLIVNQDIPSAVAGTTLDLSLQLKNASTNTAKDITVELIPPTDEDFHYEANTISLIDKVVQLKKTETADLNYSFIVKDTTKSKTYKSQLKYTYYNLYGDLTEKTQDIYIKINKGYPGIDLNINEVTYEPAIIQTGQKVQLSFLVNNNAGLSSVRSIDVSLDGLGVEGFTIVNGVNHRRINNLQPYSEGEKVTFDLFAASTLKKGSYPLKVKLVYKDSANEEQTVEKEIYLMVDSANTDIAIQNIKSPSGQINAEQNFNVSFDIVNTGEVKLEDLIVSVKSNEEVPTIVPLSQNIQIIDELEVDATKNLSYTFQPTEDAKTKSYLLNIEVKGKDETTFTTINQYVGVYVKEKKSDDSTTTSKPIVIVDKFELDPQIVNAGENFNLKVYFKNTHKTKKVENIKISLTAEQKTDSNEEKAGKVFSPVNSSSTFFIQEIAPGGVSEKELTMYTIPFAASKMHDLNIVMYYEYANGEEILTETMPDSIPVTVVQPSSFITSDINIPEMMFVGEPINLSLEISNTGRTSLDNFTVLIEGFGSSNSRTYLGNLEPGQTTYYDNDLFATEEGEVTGNLIFTYTKPDGKQEEVKKEIKTVAQAMQMEQGGDMEAGNFDMPMPPQEKKSNTKLIIIIAAIAAVVVIVTIIIIRRKIKKKKELSFDE